MSVSVFVSYSTQNTDFVKLLQRKLNGQQVDTWVDVRELTAGEQLDEQIKQAIEKSDFLIAVLCFDALASDWVEEEIKFAQAQKIKVIPVLFGDVREGHVKHFVGKKTKCLRLFSAQQVDELMPDLLAGIGLQLSNYSTPPTIIEDKPIDEMVLKLSFKAFKTVALSHQQIGDLRVTARAELNVIWADNLEPSRSPEFEFIAPFGKNAIDDIRWYIESYYQWPSGVFKQRAREIEANLIVWGQALFAAIFGFDSTKARFNEWWQQGQYQDQCNSRSRKFSVEVTTVPPEGCDDDFKVDWNRGSTELLALPWEIICGESGFWFDGGNGVAIRRRLPKFDGKRANPTSLPIRVLLLCPRPEQDENGKSVGYIDHRTSAKALLDATDKLSEQLIQLTILNPPTFAQLKQTLNDAKQNGQPFHVVHFDGHGVYDTKVGLGALCFEKPQQQDLQQRLLDLVHADELAKQMQHFGVPLFFLDACQTAMMETDPKASVATRLLESGVGAVVAMSYSVLVATAKRFVAPFYQALAQGKTVGEAILAGQQALFDDSYRFAVMGAGKLELQDWLVPVLYQEQKDGRLFASVPSEQVAAKNLEEKQNRLNELPEPPAHEFVGRSRQLLAFERLLQTQQQLVIKAGGGFGKTAIAIELCRWLVQIGKFDKVVFVDIEKSYLDHSAAENFNVILQVIGRQLENNYSAAQYENEDKALQPILRALDDHKVLLLFDNMETVLPNEQVEQLADIDKLLGLCQRLLKHNSHSHMIFTSRETLPAPFDGGRYNCALREFHYLEAIELVEKVMSHHGWKPPENDDATTPDEIKHLVEAVNCHPRALVLLAREVCASRLSGVTQTTLDLQQLMNKLHQQNPNDRENSLYASVELSLRRVPDEIRKLLSPLQVLHGGAGLRVLAVVLNFEQEQLGVVVKALIKVGLAKPVQHGYIRLDPALSHYLGLMVDGELDGAIARWQQAIMALVTELYDESFKNTPIAMQLCALELPNIMALVDVLTMQFKQQSDGFSVESLERISIVISNIEYLLQYLGRYSLLLKVRILYKTITEIIARQNNCWNRIQFHNVKVEIEHLLDCGKVKLALDTAENLLHKALVAGPKAYPFAIGDIAMAHFLHGRSLKHVRHLKQAIEVLNIAEKKFLKLVDSDDIAQENKVVALRMISTCSVEKADCLLIAGQYQQAIVQYERVLEQFQQIDDFRSQVVIFMQMATSHLNYGEYAKALTTYQKAQVLAEQFNEPTLLAQIFHQMGRVCDEGGQFVDAERFYRQSLDINVSLNKLPEQANSLVMLGNLYTGRFNKSRHALEFYYQALAIYKKLDNKQKLGVVYNNIANTLLILERYEEAKENVNLSLSCDVKSARWKSYGLLHQIELLLSQPESEQAAKKAWQQARGWYLVYRRQGGYYQTSSGQLADEVYQLLTADEGNQAQQALQQLIDNEQMPDWYKLLVEQLLLMVNGSRDKALGDNDELEYHCASEILWLIERLEGAGEGCDG